MASTSRPSRPLKLPPVSARAPTRVAAAATLTTTTPAAAALPSTSRPTSRGRQPTSAVVPRNLNGHATTPVTGTSSTSVTTSSNMVVFADLPEQLLCAPDNAAWVYSQYALSYFATEAAAQVKLEKKIRAMMREAQRHYEVSCAFFASLSPDEQRAEVLRSAGVSNMTSLVNNGGGGGGGGGGNPATNLTHPNRAAAAAATVDGMPCDDAVYRALRAAWPVCRSGRDGSFSASHATSSAANQNGFSKNSLRSNSGNTNSNNSNDGVHHGSRSAVNFVQRTEGVGKEEEEEERENAAPSYPSNLRVNLVLDIVASRKTLGATPLRSRAYRIAETIYRRVMQPAATRHDAAHAASSNGPAHAVGGVQHGRGNVTLGSSLAPPPHTSTMHPSGHHQNSNPHPTHASSGMNGNSSGVARPPNTRASAAAAAPPLSTPPDTYGSDDLRNVAAHVRTFIVGISDTDITLVGRDVVCPYRHLPSPSGVQLRLRSAVETTAETQQQQSQQQVQLQQLPQRPLSAGLAVPTSPSVSAAALHKSVSVPNASSGRLAMTVPMFTEGRAGAPVTTTTTAAATTLGTAASACGQRSELLTSVVTQHLAQRHSLESLVLLPLMRVAPVGLGQLDQTRLILCAPPIDWSAGDEA